MNRFVIRQSLLLLLTATIWGVAFVSQSVGMDYVGPFTFICVRSLIGGIVLHQGRIAEMRTGEGKTLVSTAPAYLNALTGKGVHIVTVNDYLAKRDAEWMGQIHEFLGLTVGVVLNPMTSEERKAAYSCDITYVTNNELGFDYLRDNMAIYKEQMVLRDLDYAIIDEVDSVLIDEARTPLIISGQSGKSTALYEMCDLLARRMQRGADVQNLTKMDAIMGVVQEETGDFINKGIAFSKASPSSPFMKLQSMSILCPRPSRRIST